MNPERAKTLKSKEIHVWSAFLDTCERQSVTLQTALSADELGRASRFHFERDRRRYVVARGILRILLASYLHTEVNRIQFSYSAYGKPALATPANSGLHFNASHSDSVAMFAFSSRKIGIDVERIRQDLEFQPILERFFSSYEATALSHLPFEARRRAFFVCWTRKEAYLKARGDGLAFSLDRFDVSVDSDRAMLLRVRGEPDEAHMWDLMNAHPAPDFVATVAAEGRGLKLIHREWSQGAIDATILR
jgi:4'-phosphopantetheinyl transferase